MSFRIMTRVLAAVSVFVWWSSAAAGYHLERVAPPGLNQPTYLLQVADDPSNILYYTTRISTAFPGYSSSPANTMGKLWRYDLNTRASVMVLDLSARYVYNDDGLQTFAFHPDFNHTNTAGWGKLYVSSAEFLGVPATPDQFVVPVDRVEEYFLNPTNTGLGAVYSRLILQYTNNAFNNHTVGWIGFNPTATGAEKNYLYISTADSSFQNNYNGGVSPNGRPSQNPTDVRGKILRVDVSGGDDYPADPLKNFAVPPSNPFPAYNTNNPGSIFTNVLGEIYITGLRNAYRVCFNTNGDMFWGDVGESANEEVDFLKAGSNASGPPVDYGWPLREGTNYSGVPGAPPVANSYTNPFTGVTSLNPLQAYPHTIGSAVIGGHVYHGPIPELQGKYFYADFVAGKLWMLDFDRNTDPTMFNGTNGTLTDITALWNSLIIDTNAPTYRGDTSLTTINGLDHVVAFNEDNAGNLYLVDFGFGTGFAGQYAVNAGEIFEVVPNPTLSATNTSSAINFSWPYGYKLQAQTNSLSVGVSTNWVDYPGGNTVTTLSIPLDKLLPDVLFRLTALP